MADMTTVMAVTAMHEMPKSCAECKNTECKHPLKKNGVEILKRYTTKRHEFCPLMELHVHVGILPIPTTLHVDARNFKTIQSVCGVEK